MSVGVPVPVINDKDETSKEAKILSLADLEVEGSKKLPRLARGEFEPSLISLSMSFSIRNFLYGRSLQSSISCPATLRVPQILQFSEPT